ncbi:MAG: Npt1/Npt2 family nucleotide transporter [Candidatus Acidiferrales bacterium]
MTRFLERKLNLQPGELKPGAFLFSYLFLIIASYVVAKAARDALFLDRFKAVQLPYADVAIAAMVGFVVAGYLRLARHLNLRNLLLGSLLFFASNAVLFWYLADYYQIAWLYPVIYVWVGIVFVLAPAQVWTFANYLLTTREAKRFFGLIGAGAISGWIFGGYFTKVVAQAYGTESLLLGVAAFLALCTLPVILLWRRRQAPQEGEESKEEAVGKGGPKNLWASVQLVLASPYLQAIAAVICLSSFVTTFAGWQFKAIAKEFLVEKNALAAFFGNFNFYAGIASLLFQLTLTSRLLRRFGIGATLFVVPLALLLGSVGVMVWGTLVAVVVLKGGDQVLRYSIDKSTVELLYLPVPAGIKIQVKSLIDTVIWRLGDGLAGLSLLLFATYLHLTARQVSAVNIVFIAGWFTAALVARTQYVAALRQSIREHRLDVERTSAPVLDRSTVEIFASSLQATDPQEILYALGLFEVSPNAAAHPVIRDLLTHPAPEVRRKAIAILAAAGDKTVQTRVERLLEDPDLQVRTEAMLYLARYAHIDPLDRIQELGDFPDFSIRSGVVSFLARPGPRQNMEAAQMILRTMAQESGPDSQRTRLEAARLLSVLPDQFEEEMRLLLEDPDPDVQCEAIGAAGVHLKRRFIPTLIEHLHQPRLAPAIVETLAKFGDRVVGTLRDSLTDTAVPMEARREVASLLGRIGTQTAALALQENLLVTDTTLRFRVISSLNKVQRDQPGIELDHQTVEMVLLAEIMGHYRSYQVLGTLGSDLDDPMGRPIKQSMDQELERIFRLLGLLFPQYDLHSAYTGIQSKNLVVHDNALEFIDTIFKPQMRNLLVPLIDGEVSMGERVRLANQVIGASVSNREEAVATLIHSEDPWLKACGAYAIGTMGLKALESALDHCLNHPDPLLRETARQAKLRLAALGEPAPA